jgi:hypothetical protein
MKMSTYSDASLIFYPSGYKESKLYSLKPTDGIGDLTFTRASTATRVNSDGLIETSPVNLLTYSNTFSNAAWVKDRCTVTYGQSGYDGTNDAWLMQSTATALSSRCYQVFSGNNNFNRSVYAKKGTSDYVAIYTTSSAYAYFNLSNGTIGTQSLNVNASILSVGNGWYRCSVTMSSIYQNHYIFIANSDNSTTTNSGDNIYIQDAQLNLGSTAKPYFPTTDRSNVPRIDYTGGGCGKLLLEPQRTNLLTYSEDFSNASWTKQAGITATYNTTETLSPNGTYNATKFVGNGTTGVLKTSISVSGVVSRSVYLKSVTGTTTATFKEPNTNVPSPITLTITNEWQRFEMIGDNGSSLQGLQIDDITSDGIYMWGAQLEAGSYPTSYIPTTTTAVTRVADSAAKTGISSLIGQTEGVAFLEFDNQLLTSYPNEYIFQIRNTAGTTQLWLRKESGSPYFTTRLIVSSSTIWTFGSITVPNGNTKIAISYKTGNSAIYLNGTQFGSTNTAAFSGSSFTDFYFNLSGTANPELKLQSAMLFPTVLSDDDLTLLTGTLGETYFESYALMANYLNYTIQ